MIDKIEDAYKKFKICEVFLLDVHDDSLKHKLALSRFESARSELLTLMNEAREKGFRIRDSQIAYKFFHTDLP